jgi:hypothetical protein
MPSKSVVKHLKAAKADIAAGTASFRSAAQHVAAAIKAGATQTQAADALGKSQPWVSRLLKWREAGFPGNPFDHPAGEVITAVINPGEPTARPAGAVGQHQQVTVGVTESTKEITMPMRVIYERQPEPPTQTPRILPPEPKPDRAPPRPTPQDLKQKVDSMFAFLLAYFNDDAGAMWAAVDLYRAEHPIAPVTLDVAPRGDGALH